MKKLLLLPAIAGVMLIVALAGAASPAHANFPGANGRIAFTDFTYGGTDNVFTMTPSGTDVKQLTFLTVDQGGDGEAAWSPDGTRLVFTEHSADFSVWRLWLMNVDGSNKHLLFAEDAAYNDFQGNWSPDGSRVIFRRCNDAKEACAIYTIKTTGNGLNAITHYNQTVNDFDVKPEFSPDGKTISFSSFNRGGVQNGIYLMGSHGTNIHLITPTALGAVDADWAPDGSNMVFWTHCCNPEPSAIAVVNADGSGLQQLTVPPSPSEDIRPSYSPQGDQIAFQRDSFALSTSTIMIMPAGGGTPTPIHSGVSPSWGTAG
jgi:Tol biopolymer transport system component